MCQLATHRSPSSRNPSMACVDVPNTLVSGPAEPSVARRGCMAWVRALCCPSRTSPPTTPTIPTAKATHPSPPRDPHSPSFYFSSSMLHLPTLPTISMSSIARGRDDHYDSEDDEDISEALLEEEGGSFPRARKRHHATLEWRHHHGVDDILDAGETPTPADFTQVLSIWPRWLQGRTRDGDVVLYEELGKLHGASLREARLQPKAWAQHLALVCEYVVQCVDQSDQSSSDVDDDDDDEYDDGSYFTAGEEVKKGEEEKKMKKNDFTAEKQSKPGRNNWHDVYAQGPPRPRITLVLSFAGVTSAAFFADFAVRKAVRTWGHTLAAHYPGLVHRILLVNVPTSLSPAALALLQPLRLLPPVWRTKTWLVLDDDADGTAKPVEDSHRALLAWAGLSPTTCVLRGIDSIIDSSQLSAAVCPTLGHNYGKGADSQEWAPLRRLVEANYQLGRTKEGEEGGIRQ